MAQQFRQRWEVAACAERVHEAGTPGGVQAQGRRAGSRATHLQPQGTSIREMFDRTW